MNRFILTLLLSLALVFSASIGASADTPPPVEKGKAATKTKKTDDTKKKVMPKLTKKTTETAQPAEKTKTKKK